MGTLIVVVLIVAAIVIFLCRRGNNAETKRIFGLAELKAALEIDSNISPKSLRAIVVGALGYADNVVQDIDAKKNELGDDIRTGENAIGRLKDDIDEIRRSADEEIKALEGAIASKERKIGDIASDLKNLRALEAKINS